MKRAREEDVPFEEITPEPRNELGFSRPCLQPPLPRPSASEEATAEDKAAAAEALMGFGRSDSAAALDALLGLAADGPSRRGLKFSRPPVQASVVKPTAPPGVPTQLLSNAHPRQLCLLAAAFKLCPQPTAEQRAALAQRVHLSVDAVAFWFHTRQVLETWMRRVPAEQREAQVQTLHAASASADSPPLALHQALASATHSATPTDDGASDTTSEATAEEGGEQHASTAATTRPVEAATTPVRPPSLLVPSPSSPTAVCM